MTRDLDPAHRIMPLSEQRLPEGPAPEMVERVARAIGESRRGEAYPDRPVQDGAMVAPSRSAVDAITPEMIEAGVTALLRFESRELQYSYREAVADVYAAMACVARQCPLPVAKDDAKE